jgi:hypothetical protein
VSDTRTGCRYGLQRWARVSDTREDAIAAAGCLTPGKYWSKLKAVAYGCQTPDLNRRATKCLTSAKMRLPPPLSDTREVLEQTEGHPVRVSDT